MVRPRAALPGGGYEHWPISRADLDEHYDAVESMIGTIRYPYDDTPKTKAVREAAEGAGMSVLHPPLAVSFSRRPGEDPVRLGEIPAAVRQPPRHAPRDLRAHRRVCRGLQPRGEEHPRPHLPVGRVACRRRYPHSPRGHGLPPTHRGAATRSLTSCTPVPTASRRSACRRGQSGAIAWCWPRARSARRTCCCATGWPCPA